MLLVAASVVGGSCWPATLAPHSTAIRKPPAHTLERRTCRFMHPPVRFIGLAPRWAVAKPFPSWSNGTEPPHRHDCIGIVAGLSATAADDPSNESRPMVSKEHRIVRRFCSGISRERRRV